MKILFLADPSAVHTQKWINALVKCGIDVVLVGFSKINIDSFDPRVKFYSLNIDNEIERSDTGIKKAVYLTKINKIKKIIRREQPDILHSFYASSYGALGSLTGFHPYIISVWGSDILDFPRRSFLHKKLLQFALFKSDVIQATSKFLAKATSEFTSNEISIVPFGVDTELFSPSTEARKSDTFTIGCVKGLELHYGIENLLGGFRLLREREKNITFKFKIAGRGSKDSEFKRVVNELGIANAIEFTGFIPNQDVPEFLHSLDVAVVPSLRESFGVSILEASACGLPVVVTEIPGFREVIIPDETALCVPSADMKAIADALQRLLSDAELRNRLGSNGRKFVTDNFQMEKFVDQQVKIYHRLLGIR